VSICRSSHLGICMYACRVLYCYCILLIVKCHGTEGREASPDKKVEPNDRIFEYIVFKGSDIQDLLVEEDAQASSLPTDPAIVSSQAVCCEYAVSCRCRVVSVSCCAPPSFVLTRTHICALCLPVRVYGACCLFFCLLASNRSTNDATSNDAASTTKQRLAIIS
jgi:Scd6-like Sm domain